MHKSLVIIVCIFLLLNSVNAVASLCMGINFWCALLQNGDVKCLGDNSKGQLGRLNSTQIPPPTTISNAIAVACGSSHACIIDGNGDVKCWGSSTEGQTGLGVTPSISTPQIVNVSEASSKVACGYAHTCVLTNSGNVRCWGRGILGELASGSSSSTAYPGVPIVLPDIPIEIVLGSEHACASLQNGSSTCWGLNQQGQLSIATIISPSDRVGDSGGETTRVSSISHGISKIVAGGVATCWLSADGNFSCAGDATNGLLMYGDTVTFGTTAGNTPPPVHTFQASDIFIGSENACVISLGTMSCYGINTNGELGVGDTSSYSSGALRSIVNPPNISTIRLPQASPTAKFQMCMLATRTNDAIYRVWCWGSNTYGQLGAGGNLVTPQALPVELSCGDGIVQSAEGEECEPPLTTTCDIACKLIIPATSTVIATTTQQSTAVITTQQSTTVIAPTNTQSVTAIPTSVTPTASCQGVSQNAFVNSSCVNGTIVVQTLNITTMVRIDGNISVLGDFRTSKNITLIVTPTTTITVDGCIYLDGNLNITEWDGIEILRPLKARCINGQFNSVQSETKCINSDLEQDEEHRDFSVLLIRAKTCGKSKRPLILGCIIGGVVLVAVIITVVIYIIYRKGHARLLFHDAA